MKQWLKVRQELYEQVRERVELLVGHGSKSFKDYQLEYDRHFARSWRSVLKSEVIKSVTRAKLVFLGDFHALEQSQKSHLRILDALPVRKKGVLAVEFFEAKDQALIDRFLAGDISEKSFLQKIRWEKTWGFPWPHYRRLVHWAQAHGWRVLGLNRSLNDASSETQSKSLHERDKFAAEIIARQFRQHPDISIFVIYGDLHIADLHLPRRVRELTKLKKDDTTLVFQNPEKLYFKLLKKNLEATVDAVYLKKNEFCLMNLPPWVKWQNYLLYLGQIMDRDLDPNLKRWEEETVDYTDEVARYVELLASELGVSVRKDDFSIFTASSQQFQRKLEDLSNGEDPKYFLDLISNGTSFFLPQNRIGYLAQPSVNHAAVVAMSIVYATLSGTKSYPSRLPQEFLALIWWEAVLYFGSKVINPKRKTDTIRDLKSAVQASSQRARDAFRQGPETDREPLQIALQQKMKELLYLSSGRPYKLDIKARRKSSFREAARLLGGMLGEKLFFGYAKGSLTPFTLKNILTKKIDQKDFRNVYFELVEMIESMPEPFESKREKL